MITEKMSQKEIVDCLAQKEQVLKIVRAMQILYGGSKNEHLVTMAKRVVECKYLVRNRKGLWEVESFTSLFRWATTEEGDAYWRTLVLISNIRAEVDVQTII